MLSIDGNAIFFIVKIYFIISFFTFILVSLQIKYKSIQFHPKGLFQCCSFSMYVNGMVTLNT